VSDNCKAITLALDYGTSGEIYNIGTDFRISNLEIVNKIMNELGISKNKVTFVNDRLGHDFRYALNSSKFSTNFKWSPEISFETGIISTIKWHISQIKGR
jgi:dTDP-glucose 4,6-dehydratase